MKLKLHRDMVISGTPKGDLVGVYVEVSSKDEVASVDGIGVELPDDTEILLAEMPPQKADEIIKLWNSK